MNGYAGKPLFADLSRETLEPGPLPEAMARDFAGGHGIGARVPYDAMGTGADPPGPESVLGFLTGPLEGITADHRKPAEEFFRAIGRAEESMAPTRESLEDPGVVWFEDIMEE